jgi:hypothetical protein
LKISDDMVAVIAALRVDRASACRHPLSATADPLLRSRFAVYGQQVGGSLKAPVAFGEVIAAAVTSDVVDRAEAAVAKARRGPLVAMPIDLVDE